MKANDVLIPARRELQDDFGGKWPDLVLFGYLADGLAEMLRLRPDLMLSPAGEWSAGDIGAGGTGTMVRIRHNRLEVWDGGLDKWIAVSFVNGALVPLLPPDQGESAISPEGMTLSGDTQIAIEDASLAAPLVHYVVYRAMLQYADSPEAQRQALLHYDLYRNRVTGGGSKGGL